VRHNPLGNLNSGCSGPWAKLIKSASLQLVFDAAIPKLLWRLVSRCFYMSICVFSTIRLKWLAQLKTPVQIPHKCNFLETEKNTIKRKSVTVLTDKQIPPRYQRSISSSLLGLLRALIPNVCNVLICKLVTYLVFAQAHSCNLLKCKCKNHRC